MSELFDNTGVSRLINQYRASPKLQAFIRELSEHPPLEIKPALESLLDRLDIDRMSGDNLDRIGVIVGMPRPRTGFDDNVFTFLETTNDEAKGFSGLDRPDIGGAFVGELPTEFMGDRDYRLLLKAAIFANNSGATIPELEQYSVLLLGLPANIINGFTFIDVQFQAPLSTGFRRIIEATLKPAAGIRIRTLTFGIGPNPFGFAGSAINTGFGGLGEPKTGSGFVRLFN